MLLKNTQTEFLQKQETLENARVTLKKEFIGIDNSIDEIIDNVSSWYFLSDLQEKPVVINLWGLTGVGKTSLINRLVELINYENSYYRFDLGKKEGNSSFSSALDDLCDSDDDSPVIIALDEIQHSRTIEGPFKQEVKDDKNRLIWELIDSGKIQSIKWLRGLYHLEELTYKLTHLTKAGVVVKNGVVTKNIRLFRKEMDMVFDKKEGLRFIPFCEYDTIIDLAGKHFNIQLHQDLSKKILQMNALESILFLTNVVQIAKKPRIKNFTKAIIFTIGNLYEVYRMADNFSTEIDADEFHKRSKKITIPQVKQALKTRFRNEQIARLGNIHIIYPALDKKSYQKIIEMHLIQYANKLFDKLNLKIAFDTTVHNTIYNEGVYPTQGVRPVFTSIHQIIKSKITLFITEIYKQNIAVDVLSFATKNNILTCQYFYQSSLVFEKQEVIVTTINDARVNKKDDMQAITAVHESGHTVLSIVLLKTIPNVVYSITSDADNNGFMQAEINWEYISRKEIIPRVAMILGGYVAEELIFGKENLTTGAESDIQRATAFIISMFKHRGMGKTPVHYSLPVKDNEMSYHKNEDIEHEIKQTLEAAKLLAEITLKKEKKLLLKFSDYLSDNRMLKKEDIRKIYVHDNNQMVNLIENRKLLFYRNHLKQQVQENNLFINSKILETNTAISLNKNNKLQQQ